MYAIGGFTYSLSWIIKWAKENISDYDLPDSDDPDLYDLQNLIWDWWRKNWEGNARIKPIAIDYPLAPMGQLQPDDNVIFIIPLAEALVYGTHRNYTTIERPLRSATYEYGVKFLLEHGFVVNDEDAACNEWGGTGEWITYRGPL